MDSRVIVGNIRKDDVGRLTSCFLLRAVVIFDVAELIGAGIFEAILAYEGR